MIHDYFGKAATTYDTASCIQRQIAADLMHWMPRDGTSGLQKATLLEIGCGTGHLSKLLLDHFPHHDVILTDKNPQMLLKAQENLKNLTYQRSVAYRVVNACEPVDGIGDLLQIVASNMTFQWFPHVDGVIDRWRSLVASEGFFIFTTLLPTSFSAWYDALATCGIVLHMPFENQPSHDFETYRVGQKSYRQSFDKPHDFFKMLSRVGAGGSLLEHKVSVGILRKALTMWAEMSNNTIIYDVGFYKIPTSRMRKTAKPSFR